MADWGVVGTSVMGRNLALNMLDQGFSVAAWNLERELLDLAVNASDGRIEAATSLEALASGLERPRKILVMVKAGNAVDSVLTKLGEILDEGDVVIDGGNSLFKDTERRQELWPKLHVVGMGVSGGEEGARYGPSLMPGGSPVAYQRIEATLAAIAAKSEHGPCVTHVGPGGSGHFVKMVHNGIEYAEMQAMAECYDFLARVGGLANKALADTFRRWNDGLLESYLISITAAIFSKRHRAGYLIDRVLDRAGQKGTGRWTAETALELGVAAPSIAAAIDARVLSDLKTMREDLSRLFDSPKIANRDDDLVRYSGDALLAARILNYTQGMDLIRQGSRAFDWSIDLGETARIWTAGCIIRCRFLDTVIGAYTQHDDLDSLVRDQTVRGLLRQTLPALRQVVSLAARAGVPVPVMQAGLAYFDSISSARLPQNLTQAQRDAFGAHRHQLVDNPDGPLVHTDWLE